MTATAADRGGGAEGGTGAGKREMACRETDGNRVIARAAGIETLQRLR